MMQKMMGVWGWQWYQLDHMQTVCTSHRMPPNQQRQSTEGILK